MSQAENRSCVARCRAHNLGDFMLLATVVLCEFAVRVDFSSRLHYATLNPSTERNKL